MRDPVKTRQLIVEKALAVFNTKGYRAASLSDITSAAGLTKGAIYGNFENKDEVAIAAFEYATEVITAQVAACIGAQKTAPAKLEGIVGLL